MIAVPRISAMRDYVLKKRRNRPLSVVELFTFAVPMAMAVHHLHTSRYIHRDFALRNFVLTANNEPILIDL